MFEQGRRAGKSWQDSWRKRYAIAMIINEWVEETQTWDDYYRLRYERIAWRVGIWLNRPPKDDWLKRVWDAANVNYGRYFPADWGTGEDFTVHTFFPYERRDSKRRAFHQVKLDHIRKCSYIGTESEVDFLRRIRMGDVKVTSFEHEEAPVNYNVPAFPYLRCLACAAPFTFMAVQHNQGKTFKTAEFPKFCPNCGVKREEPNAARVEEVYRQLTGVEITSDQGLKLISFIRSIVKS